MKVLLINTFETKGGAAVACKRLALALQKQGVEVNMLTGNKNTSDSFVHSVAITFFQKLYFKVAFIAERLQIFFSNGFNRKNLFAVSTATTGFNILTNKMVQEADIIHLHWINQGLLSIREIEILSKLGKPIVWTMHDMWPMTGICHHSGECTRFRNGCGSCKFLNKPYPHDLSYKVYRIKRKAVSNRNIHYVACSQWLRKKTEGSLLLTGNHMTNIPNPINTDFFVPGDKIQARKDLGLPTGKKLILFGAAIVSDKKKGIDYLIQATHLLADLKETVELVYFGEVKSELAGTFGLNTHPLGYLSNMATIAKMYQAVDCFVTPSLEENLPNMIMEAMSCGVPCVGFDTGGIPEMIIHRETGYVAQYKSAEDLALGIRTILAESDEKSFNQAARTFVLANYSESIVAEHYLRLYNTIEKCRMN